MVRLRLMNLMIHSVDNEICQNPANTRLEDGTGFNLPQCGHAADLDLVCCLGDAVEAQL